MPTEPAIADSRSSYTGLLVHDYVQNLVTALHGRDPVRLAQEWTRTLRDAIRSRDRRHLIRIELLPVRDWAFDQRNVADLPRSRDGPRVSARRGRRELDLADPLLRRPRPPLLLGVTFAFARRAEETFVLAVRGWLDGSLSFCDGRAPEEVRPATVADAAYFENLITSLGLRTSLLASPPYPANP